MSASILTNNSKYISLVPQNQQEFTQGQKCVIELPPDIGAIKGSDSYLAIDVLNTSARANRWALPGSAQVLIEQVDIFAGSGAGGMLLESLQNYNQWAAVEELYERNDWSSSQSKEGGPPLPEVPLQCTGLRAVETDRVIECGSVEKASVNGQFSPIDVDGNAKFTSRRVCIPLKCGIFNHWAEEEKIVPVLALHGLRIEITFAQNDLCLARIGHVQNGVSKDSVTEGFDFGAVIIGATTVDISDITSIEASGLAVGVPGKYQRITFKDAVNEETVSITGLALAGTTLTVTFTPGLTNAYNPATPATLKVAEGEDLSYRVTKCELRAVQIIAPPEMERKMLQGMKYPFITYSHFIDTIPAASQRHVVDVPSTASRSKAMFSMLVDTSKETSQQQPHYLSGDPPSASKLNSLVYYIANRLHPLRPYDPRARRDRCLTLNETSKAFAAINKMSLSLGSSDGSDLDGYTNPFLCSRELGRGQYSYDLRAAEPQIRLGFTGTRASNFRVHTFVFQENVIHVSSDGVSIEI